MQIAAKDVENVKREMQRAQPSIVHSPWWNERGTAMDVEGSITPILANSNMLSAFANMWSKNMKQKQKILSWNYHQ